jgi:hypothetical protein
MVTWPGNKKFAFSIVDDTDCSTLANAPIVYDYLNQCGLKTTKSVWIFDGETREDNKRIIGTTCQDKQYLDWVLKLKGQGFEIALHSSSWSRSERDRVINALDVFKSYFGKDPTMLVQHPDTKHNESMYWGANRVGGVNKLIYKAIMSFKGRQKNIYHGESSHSPYFWGDVCKDRIKYVRNFVCSDVNTLKVCPIMPYHDPQRRYVNLWFASSEGPDVNSFNACISEQNQRRLENEGGACIVYTHFGTDFVLNGTLNADFKELIAKLSKKDGWFVPASELLDYLVEKNGDRIISNSKRSRLERMWLWHKLRIGTS